MSKLKVISTSIDGLYIFEPTVFKDERGYFMESYNEKELEGYNLNLNFVQDNESKSTKDVLRGLHFQRKYAQDKLVRVIEGEIFDVAVDLRSGSDSFGKWEGFILSGDNKRQLYIPKGFAHGFLVLSEKAIFSYKCTEYYHPEYDGGIKFDDKDLNINWPVDSIENVIVSNKDRNLPSLNELIQRSK